MRILKTWGGVGAAAFLTAIACSGTKLNDVGDLNSHGGAGGSGGAGASQAGGNAAGSADHIPAGDAGADTGSGGSNGGRAGASHGGFAGAIDPGGLGARGGAINGTGGAPDPITGTGGTPDPVEGAAGESGLECDYCQAVATGDIRGIAASSDTVYWSDFGTTDILGNYNDDGRLLSRPLAGGDAQVFASSLHEPQTIALSAHYAYVLAGQTNFKIFRLPLAGGAAEPVQDLPSQTTSTGYQVFAATSGYEYWAWDGAIYRVADTAGASYETFVSSRDVLWIRGSEGALYFQDRTGIYSVDPVAKTPVLFSSLSTDEGGSLTLMLVDGDYVYAQEVSSQTYLARAPKAGGSWKRLARTAFGETWSQLEISGNDYYLDNQLPYNGAQISHGELSSTNTPAPLFSLSKIYLNAWTSTSVGIFFSYQNQLSLAPLN